MKPELKRKSRTGAARRFLLTLSYLLILSAALGGWYYYDRYWPSSERVPPDFGGVSRPVFYNGEQTEWSAVGEQEGLKLPLELYRELLDPNIWHEQESRSVIITTHDKVIRLKTDERTGVINEKPFSLRFPVEEADGTLYLPVEPLRDFYGIDVLTDDRTGAVILRKAGDEWQWGRTMQTPKRPERTFPLRKEPSVKAPIYADLAQDEPVIIWGETDGWYRIQLLNGVIGYADQRHVYPERRETFEREPVKTFAPWKPPAGKINLTWQQVYRTNPDTSKLPPMPGVNVFSPQWFHLEDGDGNLRNLADASVSAWARSRGYQLWALFSNSFDPELTTQALATYDKRMNMIRQLVAFAQMYDIQGLNIDFENVYLKDKENFVQFVRELTPFMHELGVVVSVDVTVKGGSETYSLFLDRKALGQTVDYMIVMTYDEHWAASPKAGSVASLPWVERGIARIIEEDDVPPEKLLLGIPFYTRLWTEETVDGGVKVSSKTYSMEAVNKLLAEKNLTPVFDEATGQHYIEFSEDGKTMKMWIEDAVSIKSRVELVHKYGLAGVASWSRGFETPNIWEVIRETLNGKSSG